MERERARRISTRVPAAAFEELAPLTGFLTDRRIRAALDAGFLLQPGTWERALIRHASYTLRLGRRAYVREANNREKVEKEVSEGRPLRLGPGATARLYSHEIITLPNNVMGFTVARGLPFEQPLVPENTYIDPGFTGDIYTVVTNMTGHVIALPFGLELTRLFFYRLPEDVENPYQRGQDLRVRQILDVDDAAHPATRERAAATPIGALITTSGELPIPGSFVHAELFDRLRRWIELVAVAVVVWPLLLAAAVSSQSLHHRVGGKFGSTVAATILAAAMLAIARTARDKYRAR